VPPTFAMRCGAGGADPVDGDGDADDTGGAASATGGAAAGSGAGSGVGAGIDVGPGAGPGAGSGTGAGIGSGIGAGSGSGIGSGWGACCGGSGMIGDDATGGVLRTRVTVRSGSSSGSIRTSWVHRAPSQRRRRDELAGSVYHPAGTSDASSPTLTPALPSLTTVPSRTRSFEYSSLGQGGCRRDGLDAPECASERFVCTYAHGAAFFFFSGDQ
jgi:hypothetical protein